MKILAAITKEQHDELIALDPEFAEAYTETDAPAGFDYRLNIEDVESASDTTGLVQALKRERENVKSGTRDNLRLTQRLERAEATAADATPSAEFESLKAENASIKTALSSHLKQTVINEAVAEHNAFPELGTLQLADKVQIEIRDGFATPYVEIETDGKTERVTVSEYTKQLSARASDPNNDDPSLSRLFKANITSGAATPPNNSGDIKPAAKVTRRSLMTTRQKVDYQKEHGPDALLNLPL